MHRVIPFFRVQVKRRVHVTLRQDCGQSVQTCAQGFSSFADRAVDPFSFGSHSVVLPGALPHV